MGGTRDPAGNGEGRWRVFGHGVVGATEDVGMSIGTLLSELLGLIDDAGFTHVGDAIRRVPQTFDRTPTASSYFFTMNIYADRAAAT